MKKHKLFGILALIVGIMMVFTLSGCSLDKLLNSLIPDEEDDYYGSADYPSGYSSGNDSYYDPNGTWDFGINGQSATIVITGSYSWTLNGPETTMTGTLSSSGNSKTLTLYDSSYTKIGSAEITSNISMDLTLVSPSEMAGFHNATKRINYSPY